MKEDIPHPPVTSEQEWRRARLSLLEKEKALIHQMDAVNAELRRLPMVKVEKDYVFDGPDGKIKMIDLFAGQRQLIVYHFMFDPAWEKGCPGCTGMINSIGDLSMLAERNTTYICVSRAPIEKLMAYKKAQGWDITWVSSFNNDFNYDYHVTMDESKRPREYNYKTQAEQRPELAKHTEKGEQHGLSVFFRVGDEIFHTYSTYARGCESVNDVYRLLDRTPYGRQESFEDSPKGWPQKPTYE